MLEIRVLSLLKRTERSRRQRGNGMRNRVIFREDLYALVYFLAIYHHTHVFIQFRITGTRGKEEKGRGCGHR